ncbi:MAG: G8 domain-containing protein, partial [Porphyrobacter sp.]|nr:G8 domain-containing protein [Porphyrobacter sp.]
MRLVSRVLLVCLLLPGSLLGAGGGAAIAQDDHSTHMNVVADAAPVAMRTVRWSDPAAWPDRQVPREGEAVTIARDMDVILDVTPPALRSITVQGKLTFADERDLDLVTDWIYVPGGEV